MKRLERGLIRRWLSYHDGDIYKTAKSLRAHPTTIYRKIQKHKLGNFWLECRKVKA